MGKAVSCRHSKAGAGGGHCPTLPAPCPSFPGHGPVLYRTSLKMRPIPHLGGFNVEGSEGEQGGAERLQQGQEARQHGKRADTTVANHHTNWVALLRMPRPVHMENSTLLFIQVAEAVAPRFNPPSASGLPTRSWGSRTACKMSRADKHAAFLLGTRQHDQHVLSGRKTGRVGQVLPYNDGAVVLRTPRAYVNE